jgi:hypothetical protein
VGERSGRTAGAPARSEMDEWGRTMTDAETLCPKCGGATDGWKCAICGAVATEHDEHHVHAGSDRYCTMRCAACQQADVLCTCV